MSEKDQLVLVVDDEVHILHVVSMKLRNAGYKVITANDGEEAMEMAVTQSPALLITDYQMPYMTGLELCMALKKDVRTKYLPAMMLTARGFNLAQEYMVQTNIVDVLDKPFSPREILTRVQELLGAKTIN